MVYLEGPERRDHPENLERQLTYQTSTSRMYVQTALQVHPDHQVSQDSQEIKATRDLQEKTARMDSKVHLD